MAETAIPPATLDESWRDDPLAARDAAAVLRLPPSGAEFARLEVCAVAAGVHICQFLDRWSPIPGVTPGVPPGPLRFAQSQVTVELYRRKDAPFGVLDAWSPDSGTVRVGTDPLSGVKSLLTPYRTHWGIA